MHARKSANKYRNGDDAIHLTESGIRWLRQEVRNVHEKFSSFYEVVAASQGLGIEAKSFERAFQRAMNTCRMPCRYIAPAALALGVDVEELRMRLQTDAEGYSQIPVASLQCAVYLVVQLRTFQIALGVDLEQEDLREVYASTALMLTIVQQRIADFPVVELRGSSVSRRIFHLGCRILHEGICPHLTRWGHRFNHWAQNAVAQQRPERIVPDLQIAFPQIRQLELDLRLTTRRLGQFRKELEGLILG